MDPAAHVRSTSATLGGMLGHEALSSRATQNGLAATAAQGRRVSYMGPPDANAPGSKTLQRQSLTSATTTAQSAAKRELEAARFKALQRMPYPTVISRMKLLLERLRAMQQSMQAQEDTTSRGGTAGGAPLSSDQLPSSRFAHRSTAGGMARPGTSAGGAQHSNMHSSMHNSTHSSMHGSMHSGVHSSGSQHAGLHTMQPHTGGGKSSGGASVATHNRGPDGSDTRRSDMDGVDTVAMNKIIEELQVMFSFVSEFVRRLPASARLGMANVVRVESYKKDQIVFDTGDVATQFYIILTGSVQVFGHPPGVLKPRNVFTTLTRGDMLGELALLNNTRRGAAVSPLTSCTMLVIDKEDFLEVLGPQFRLLQDTMQTFMQKQVPAIASASHSEVEHLCRNLMRSRYKQGKEFEIGSEAQVYFLAEGTAHLEIVGKPRPATSAHGHHSSGSSSMPDLRHSGGTGDGASSSGPISVAGAGGSAGDGGGSVATRRGLGSNAGCSDDDDDDSFVLSATGLLSGVRMQHGMAVGTLGTEGHKEAIRKRNISRCVVAQLELGACFGGGSTLLGAGDMQGHLRVVVTSPLAEVYRIDVDAFVKHTTPALLKAVRDDTAFRLTYWLGRKATITPDTVVGHQDASLMLRPPAVIDDEDVASTMGGNRDSCPADTTLEGTLRDMMATGSAVAGVKMGDAGALTAGAATLKASTAAKRTARAKPDHVAGSGKYGPGTMSAIRHMQQLQAQLGLSDAVSPSNDHAPHSGSDSSSATMRGAAAGASTGSTAAQRYWSNPDNSASGTPLTPLLKSLYAEGLAPLAEKLDEVAARAERRGQDGLALLVAAAGKSRPVSAAVGRKSFVCTPHATAASPRTLAEDAGDDAGDGNGVDDASNDVSTSYGASTGIEGGHAIHSPAAANAQLGAPVVAWQRPSTASAVLQQFSSLDPSSMYGRTSSRPGSAMPASGRAASSIWHKSGTAAAGANSQRPSTAGPGSGMPAMRHERPGSLIAAGIIWSRTSEAAAFTPPLRQCLTFEEIRSSRTAVRAASASKPQQQQQGPRHSTASRSSA